MGSLFLRLYLWVRNPPSPKQAKIAGGIVGIGLLFAGLEALDLLPSWVALEGSSHRMLRVP